MAPAQSSCSVRDAALRTGGQTQVSMGGCWVASVGPGPPCTGKTMPTSFPGAGAAAPMGRGLRLCLPLSFPRLGASVLTSWSTVPCPSQSSGVCSFSTAFNLLLTPGVLSLQPPRPTAQLQGNQIAQGKAGEQGAPCLGDGVVLSCHGTQPVRSRSPEASSSNTLSPNCGPTAHRN